MKEDPHVAVNLSNYKKEDFKRMSWEEYGKILDNLYKKVSKYLEENHLKVDAIVPILRGGAFPGTYLAMRLGVLRILPIQYKYFFKDGDLNKIKLLRLSELQEAKLPKNPVLLVAEQNMCFGLTAETTAKYLRKKYPTCKLILAADSADYSYQNTEGFDAVFSGTLSNDTKAISEEMCKKLRIDSHLKLFPWENLDEEYTTVQAKQFKYMDLDNIDEVA